MSLNASLANALSGLRVNNKLTEATSNNLANALTDSYGRQIVEVSSMARGGAGAGVRVAATTRAMAPEYTLPRREADSDAAHRGAVADALVRLGAALGEAGGEDGLFLRLSEFETSLGTLANAPEESTRQDAAIEKARDLAAFLNRLSQTGTQIRQRADTEIAAQVARVNGNLALIDDLNGKIQLLAGDDLSLPTLVNEREKLIDEVSAAIPVKTQVQRNGEVHLYTAEGIFLLREDPAPLSFTPNPTITPAMAYAPGGAGALSGLSVGTQEITPGAGTIFAVRSGSLAGQFAIRDQAGTAFQDRIDRFAADLIARFEDPAVDPTLAAGDPGLFTDAGGVLDISTIEGLAGRISVNALADPVQGGSAAALRDGLQAAAPAPASSDTILRNMLGALRTRSTTTVPGLGGLYSSAELAAGIVEQTALARTDAEAEAGRTSATRATLAEAEAARIGVDQDAELSRLIQIEQAYNANVRIIQTVSEMLQEIVELR